MIVYEMPVTESHLQLSMLSLVSNKIKQCSRNLDLNEQLDPVVLHE